MAATAARRTRRRDHSSCTARRLKGLRWIAALVALGGGAAWGVVSQILEIYSGSLTTFQYTGSTRVQGVRPLHSQRGVNIDGSLRAGPFFGWSSAGNPFEGGVGQARVGDVVLAIGAYSPMEVDLALPAPGMSRWVIGRTHSHVQVTSGAAHQDSNGPQGYNWFQSSQPELRLYDDVDNTKDVMYLVYGADRYLEFQRTGSSSNEYKGKNGAAGYIQYSSGSPDTWIYYDQLGTRTYFFGSNTASNAADWQIWKIVDPAGNVAYVGDASTASTAVTNGYNSDGTIKKAYDGAGRRYCYSYTTVGVSRLTQVKVETMGDEEAGWAACGSDALVAQVDYAYYTADADDHGKQGDLKKVTVTTPLTDGVGSLLEKRYYRYYDAAWSDSDGRRGELPVGVVGQSVVVTPVGVGVPADQLVGLVVGPGVVVVPRVRERVVAVDVELGAVEVAGLRERPQLLARAVADRPRREGPLLGLGDAVEVVQAVLDVVVPVAAHPGLLDVVGDVGDVGVPVPGDAHRVEVLVAGQVLGPDAPGGAVEAIEVAVGLGAGAVQVVEAVGLLEVRPDHLAHPVVGVGHQRRRALLDLVDPGAVVGDAGAGAVVVGRGDAAGGDLGAADGVPPAGGLGVREAHHVLVTDDGQSYKFVYDAFGRLRKINNQSSNLVTEYTYNGLNQRTSWKYDTDNDGDTDGNDLTYSFAYDDQWRIVATYRSSDTSPKEVFVYHAAGLGGRGGASGGIGGYIDHVVLRDKDASTAWTSAADALDERDYYCQNWRADTSALLTSAGKLIESVKHSAYGTAIGLPAGDTDSDGKWDGTDKTNISTSMSYDVRKDPELDGDVDANDTTYGDSIASGNQTLGRGVLTSTAVKNRKGYAGYENDGAVSEFSHVRNRVLSSKLERWTRRDPIGYVDGAQLYAYAAGDLAHSDPSGTSSLPCGGGSAPLGGPCQPDPSPAPTPTPLPDPAPPTNCIASTTSLATCIACCESFGSHSTACISDCITYWTTQQPGTPPANHCCTQACNDNPNDAGITICCYGFPVACLCNENIENNPQPRTHLKSTCFKTLFKACIRQHENEHLPSTDCRGADRSSPTDPGRNTYPGGRDCDELDRWKNTLACISSIDCRTKCPHDSQCAVDKLTAETIARQRIRDYDQRCVRAR